jgi:hypothetical protein
LVGEKRGGLLFTVQGAQGTLGDITVLAIGRHIFQVDQEGSSFAI